MKPTSANTNRKGLPQNIPPTLLRRGICVQVPDDPEYIALFMGALFGLSKQSIYDRDPLHKAKQVAAVWRAVHDQTKESLALGEECNNLGFEEDSCVEYQPNNSLFGYAPNDPFSTPNLIPAGYLFPPFYTNPLIPLPGVLPGDAMVNFASIPVAANLPELLAAGLPRIYIPVEGTGEVEIELVKIPQGGIALIRDVDNIELPKVLDLNSVAIVGLPAIEDILDVVLLDKVQETEIVEFEFTTPGAHTIEVAFLPNIGDAILLGFGGGLRRVSYCAGAQTGAVQVPEFRILNCNLEWRPNNSAAWSILGNVCGADGEDGQDGAPGAPGADATLPVGSIIMWGTTSPPTGWVMCDGNSYGINTYPELYAVIETTFGDGNNPPNTFNVPDFSQRVPRGYHNSADANTVDVDLAELWGTDEVTLTLTNIPPHSHNINGRQNSTAGTAANFMRGSGAGTAADMDTGNAGGSGGVTIPVPIVNRSLGIAFIIKAVESDSDFNVQFQVVDCELQWRKNAAGQWVTLADLSTCTVEGRTPEFRMQAIDADTQAVQYKYTDEPDLPGSWRDIGYLDDGAPGQDGNSRPEAWRLISETATRRVLQRRYTDEPEVPGSWQTVGSWDIPIEDDCCPEIPAPGDILVEPDRCVIAWGLATRIAAEAAAMVEWVDANYIGYPLSTVLREAIAFDLIRNHGIFLSRFPAMYAFVDTYLEAIADDTAKNSTIATLNDPATIAILAEYVYTYYDANYRMTDQHKAIIANNMLAAYPGLNPVALLAAWFDVSNVERLQDLVIQASFDSDPVDCLEFEPPSAETGAFFSFVSNGGDIFEDNDTYTTFIRLSLPAGGTLGTETRVYYAAQDLTAINGTDYYLPAGFVTFPANANNNTQRQLAFSVFDNEIANEPRQMRVKITEIVGNGIPGDIPNHMVTIRDNEDFYLVLEAGTDLERIDTWTWRAKSAGNTETKVCWIRSMNFDASRCFKVKSVTFEGVNPSSKLYFVCGTGFPGGGIPDPATEVHMLRYQHNFSGQFTVTVEIEPA